LGDRREFDEGHSNQEEVPETKNMVLRKGYVGNQQAVSKAKKSV